MPSLRHGLRDGMPTAPKPCFLRSVSPALLLVVWRRPPARLLLLFDFIHIAACWSRFALNYQPLRPKKANERAILPGVVMTFLSCNLGLCADFVTQSIGIRPEIRTHSWPSLIPRARAISSGAWKLTGPTALLLGTISFSRPHSGLKNFVNGEQ
jgi:hypothetical protein